NRRPARHDGASDGDSFKSAQQQNLRISSRLTGPGAATQRQTFNLCLRFKRGGKLGEPLATQFARSTNHHGHVFCGRAWHELDECTLATEAARRFELEQLSGPVPGENVPPSVSLLSPARENELPVNDCDFEFVFS